MKEIKNFRIIDITLPTDVGNKFDPYRESGLWKEGVTLINIGRTHDQHYLKYHHLFLVIDDKELNEE